MAEVKKYAMLTVGVLVGIYVLRQVPFTGALVNKALAG
jgi:hypothetical protein